MKTAFEREGDLRGVDILAAFVTLWREKTTGSLHASRPAGNCSFEISNGEVVGASSSDPRFETSAILVRAGKVAAEGLERLSAPAGSDRALAALQAGILTKREWRWGEKIRAIEILSDLLVWTQGEYEFDSSARPDVGELRLPIPRLLLELFLRSRDRNLIDHQLGPPDVPLVRAENFDEEFSTFGLTADAESVVRLIDGRASAAEISRKAPADEFAVQKLLAALVTLKLVRPEFAAAEPAPAAARKQFGDSEREFPPRESEPAREEVLSSPAAPERETVIPELPEVPESATDSSLRFPSTQGVEGAPAWQPRETVSSQAPLPSPLDAYEVSPAATYDSPLEEEPGGVQTPGTESEIEEFEPLPAEPPYQTLDAGQEPPAPPASRRTGAFLAWSALLLIAAVAAFLLVRSRTQPPPTEALPPAVAPEDATPAAESPSLPARPGAIEISPAVPAGKIPPPGQPAAAPASPAAAQAGPARPKSPSRTTVEGAQTTGEAGAAAAARPTSPPRVAVVRPAAVPGPPAGSSPASGVAGDSRGAWTARARRYQERLASEPATRYAVQLELACEVPTLQAAWRHDRPAGTMWVLPATHAGRSCFRVLWGRYASLDAARSAKRGIPSFFVTANNRPAVVAVR